MAAFRESSVTAWVTPDENSLSLSLRTNTLEPICETNMAYSDSLIVEHIQQTHASDLLTEREKHFIGLAVTMTRGCQVCTRNRVEKARNIGITDDELNALVAVTSAVNSGVTAATARVAFGMLDQESAEECGEVCSPTPGKAQA